MAKVPENDPRAKLVHPFDMRKSQPVPAKKDSDIVINFKTTEPGDDIKDTNPCVKWENLPAPKNPKPHTFYPATKCVEHQNDKK